MTSRKRSRRSRRQPEAPLSQSTIYISSIPTSFSAAQPSRQSSTSRSDKESSHSITGTIEKETNTSADVPLTTFDNARAQVSFQLSSPPEIDQEDSGLPVAQLQPLPPPNEPCSPGPSSCDAQIDSEQNIQPFSNEVSESNELDSNDYYSDLFEAEDYIVQLMNQDTFDAFHRTSDDIAVDPQTPPPELSTLSENESVTISKLIDDLKGFMKRTVFLAVISLYGKVRYTCENYEHLVAMMKDGDSVNVLPCLTTMRQSIRLSLSW